MHAITACVARPNKLSTLIVEPSLGGSGQSRQDSMSSLEDEALHGRFYGMMGAIDAKKNQDIWEKVFGDQEKSISALEEMLKSREERVNILEISNRSHVYQREEERSKHQQELSEALASIDALKAEISKVRGQADREAACFRALGEEHAELQQNLSEALASINSVKEENITIRVRASEDTARLQAIKQEHVELQQQFSEVSASIDAVKEENSTLRGQADRNSARLWELEPENTELQQKVNKVSNGINILIRRIEHGSRYASRGDISELESKAFDRLVNGVLAKIDELRRDNKRLRSERNVQRRKRRELEKDMSIAEDELRKQHETNRWRNLVANRIVSLFETPLTTRSNTSSKSQGFH